ncbi:hypothetical protein [Mangrovimonas futianensis]|nr:hypothetical protein [Mangrovimonas futianensis]
MIFIKNVGVYLLKNEVFLWGGEIRDAGIGDDEVKDAETSSA